MALRPADLIACDDELVAAAGFRALRRAPDPVHFPTGVFGALRVPAAGAALTPSTDQGFASQADHCAASRSATSSADSP